VTPGTIPDAEPWSDPYQPVQPASWVAASSPQPPPPA